MKTIASYGGELIVREPNTYDDAESHYIIIGGKSLSDLIADLFKNEEIKESDYVNRDGTHPKIIRVPGRYKITITKID